MFRKQTGRERGRHGGITVDQMLKIQASIRGWLTRPAAAFSHLLLAELREAPIMEIGVFFGRYLSVLRAATDASRPIIGYDLFDQVKKEMVFKGLENAFGRGSNIKLIKYNSMDLKPEIVLEDCGQRPIFISIDGSHDVGPVESDLWLSESVLADDGVVALDDFLNPYAVGVNEAFYKYELANQEHQESGRLVPFVYVGNKLFLANRLNVEEKRDKSERIIERLIHRPMFKTFRDRQARGSHTETKLLGHRVITVTL